MNREPDDSSTSPCNSRRLSPGGSPIEDLRHAAQVGAQDGGQAGGRAVADRRQPGGEQVDLVAHLVGQRPQRAVPRRGLGAGQIGEGRAAAGPGAAWRSSSSSTDSGINARHWAACHPNTRAATDTVTLVSGAGIESSQPAATTKTCSHAHAMVEYTRAHCAAVKAAGWAPGGRTARAPSVPSSLSPWFRFRRVAARSAPRSSLRHNAASCGETPSTR